MPQSTNTSNVSETHRNRHLSKDESDKLNTPPQVAHYLLCEGKAGDKELWTLWFRSRVLLGMINTHIGHGVEEVEVLASRLNIFFYETWKTGEPYGAGKDLLGDIQQLNELAEEIQREIGRSDLQRIAKEAYEYCTRIAGSLPSGRTPC